MPLPSASQPVNVYDIGYTVGQKEIVLLQSHGVYAIDIQEYLCIGKIDHPFDIKACTSAPLLYLSNVVPLFSTNCYAMIIMIGGLHIYLN